MQTVHTTRLTVPEKENAYYDFTGGISYMSFNIYNVVTSAEIIFNTCQIH